MDFSIENSRSYATEAALVKALTKYGFAQDRYTIVLNRAGRFTAIFPFSNIKDGNVMRYSHRGFMTIG